MNYRIYIDDLIKIHKKRKSTKIPIPKYRNKEVFISNLSSLPSIIIQPYQKI